MCLALGVSMWLPGIRLFQFSHSPDGMACQFDNLTYCYRGDETRCGAARRTASHLLDSSTRNWHALLPGTLGDVVVQETLPLAEGNTRSPPALPRVKPRLCSTVMYLLTVLSWSLPLLPQPPCAMHGGIWENATRSRRILDSPLSRLPLRLA